MHVSQDASIAPYTTFGIDARVQHLMFASTTNELVDALRQYPHARVLGGGSNVLVSGPTLDAVIGIAIAGREVLHDDGEHVTVRFGAGETWHDVVEWCVTNGWGGLENLALIPGTAGAAPLQNIGAYGVEQKTCFVECTVLLLDGLHERTMTNAECGFGYRDSIFKRELQGHAIVTSVTYRVCKHPVVNTAYADVRNELEAMGVANAGIREVFDAVVAVRRRKLPDPAQIGNAGSFFKNPVVDAVAFQKLHDGFGDMPSYAQPDGTVKLAAAWLIDQCGWKGYRRGDAGVHTNQALVLVNYGGATGADILQLAADIQASVQQRFGVALEREVNIW